MLEIIGMVFLLYLLLSGTVYFLLWNDDPKDKLEEKINRIDALLPQTQCGDCGYPGCMPYARAIVEDDAPLSLCPPGGEGTVRNLSALLGRTTSADEISGWGISAPETGHAYRPPVAFIDEEACIGCVKCIIACPVDAIMGSAKQLHFVIPEYCTGCRLCVPPCPVDCISMVGQTGALLQKPITDYRPGHEPGYVPGHEPGHGAAS